jgi:hypothetical protein
VERPRRDRPLIAYLFGQAVIALTFGASTVSKLRDRGGFVQSVQAFQLVPPHLTGAVATGLTSAEVVVVALLVAGAAPALTVLAAPALVLAVALLLVYGAGLVSVRVRGLHVPCHCFGANPVPVSWYDVARNVVLLGVAAISLVAGAPAQPLTGLDAALVVLVAAGAALVVTNLATVVHTAVKTAGTD